MKIEGRLEMRYSEELKENLLPDVGEPIEGMVNWKGDPARKDEHGGIRASLPILAVYALESMVTLALASNVVTYFNEDMHLDMADAAVQMSNLMGTNYLLTIVVALFADLFVGRFTAVLVAALVECLGYALLAFQAHSPQFKPLPCRIHDPNSHCVKVSGANAAILFVGLYTAALGSAGLKSVLPAHGADQFDDEDVKEADQKSSFFNWLVMAASAGSAVGVTVLVWVQFQVGWDWGFGIFSIAMLCALITNVAGLPIYRIYVISGSSALVDFVRVYVAAIRNRKLQLPEDPSELHEIAKDTEGAIPTEYLPHTDAFRFLDKAAIQRPSTYHFPNPWKLCTVTQVENVKIILNMLPIFCFTCMMTLCLAQLQSFSVQQAMTMDRSITSHFQIPPASLPLIPFVCLVVIIPVYDRWFVPFARKYTGIPTGITNLQRVGVGLVFSVLSMAAAGILEVKRKQVARDHGMLDATQEQPLPISVFWQGIPGFIFGMADMFTYIGMLEFFYSQVPKDIKSISTCFLWTSMAIGYYMSTIIVKIVNVATKHVTNSGGWLTNDINKGHLELFYVALCILCTINFCIYLLVSRRYRYRQEIVR